MCVFVYCTVFLFLVSSKIRQWHLQKLHGITIAQAVIFSAKGSKIHGTTQHKCSLGVRA